MEPELGHVHFVLVLRVDEDLVEVERPRPERLAAVDERPRRAAVVGAVQAASRALRFDLRVDHFRIRLRDVDPDLADQVVGQSVADAAPVVAAIRGLVDAAFARRPAADDRPRLALRAPRARVNLVRIRRVDRDRDDAGLIVDEQHLLPGPAAILRPIHAAIGSPSERVARGRDVRDVGILRMYFQLADLSDFPQADELPRAPGVGRAVHTAAENHIRPNRFAAGADVDDVRVGIGDVNGPDRSGCDLSVAHRRPGDAEVLRFPHAAAGRAHVEHVGLRADAGRGRRTAPAMRADRSPPQILIRVRIDRAARRCLRVIARLLERDHRQESQRQKKDLSHGCGS